MGCTTGEWPVAEPVDETRRDVKDVQIRLHRLWKGALFVGVAGSYAALALETGDYGDPGHREFSSPRH